MFSEDTIELAKDLKYSFISFIDSLILDMQTQSDVELEDYEIDDIQESSIIGITPVSKTDVDEGSNPFSPATRLQLPHLKLTCAPHDKTVQNW